MPHNWRLGVRFGPNASGIFSHMVSDLNAAPPGIGRAGFREVMGDLRSPGQAGYLPSIATDALLGFSVMAYQSAIGHGVPVAKGMVAPRPALRDHAREPARGVKENLSNGRKWETVLVALAPPTGRRLPVTCWGSTLETRRAGFNCGGISALGRFDFLLRQCLPATMVVCPLPGIGLLSIWR